MAEVDVESDPESDVQMTGEEEFFEEVMGELQKACTEKEVFRAIVAELELIRQAHSQKTIDLNKAVIRAIIELPGVKHQQAASCAAYVEGLKKVIDRFDALLKPIKGRKGAFLLDSSVVAGSLIKLLKGNKKMTEEWRDANKCNDIIVVLKEAEIVNEKQASEIIMLATKELFPTAQESGDKKVNPECVGGQPSTSTTVSELLISKAQSSAHASPEPSPDPGTGEFSAVFDHRGGRLGTYWSDDYLEIPKDAIPKGERWRVSGFIHTSLNRYHLYADYSKGERLIAPVVQYRVEGGKHFKKLVKAVIHHSIKCACKSLEDKVSVLLQSESNDDTGKFIEECLPYKNQRKEEGTAYFDVDSSHITIYTYHFSTILCKMCDHEHRENVRVKAMLYGQLNQDSDNSYCATLELYVCVQSALNRRAVFFESFHNEQKAAGNRYLGSRYFPLLLTDIERNDRIVLSTQDVTQGWNVLPSANMDYVASDYIPCLQQPSDLEHVDTLMLRGQSAKLNGMLTVSINREHRRPSSLKISFSLSAAGVIPSVSSAGLCVSSEQWKLPDRKLNYVAQKISNWYGVGLNLDISADELDVIEADMCKEHPRRKVFEMLRLWRDLNHSMFTESDLRATLRDALSKVSPVQTEAIEVLNSGANQIQVDSDLRGNAVVMQVENEDANVEPVGLGVDVRHDPPAQE